MRALGVCVSGASGISYTLQSYHVYCTVLAISLQIAHPTSRIDRCESWAGVLHDDSLARVRTGSEGSEHALNFVRTN